MDPYFGIPGLPVSLRIGGDGFYVQAVFTTVFIQGSPVVIDLNPPVAGVENIDAPALLRALLDRLGADMKEA